MTENAPQAANANGNCACLCGNGLNHPRSNFLQGHDQRFVGLLALDVVDGTLSSGRVEQLQLPGEVDGWDIQERITVTGNAVSKFFSSALAAKFDSAAHRRWAKTGKGGKNDPAGDGQTKNTVEADAIEALREQAAGAGDYGVQAPAKDEELAVVPGAAVKVKVGRWEYDATVHGMNQSGKVTAVRYYSAGGKEIVKTEGQFKIV
jgi:hypothetical protein